MRVLVIDDDSALNRLTAFALRERGLFVVTTTSAREGLRIAATEAFDALLLDVVMPEIDGPAVVRELRASPATRDLPVVFVSAKEHAIDEIDRNVRGVIRKPFDPAGLPAELFRLLDVHETPEEGAGRDVPPELRREFLVAAVARASAIARGLDALQRRPTSMECLSAVAAELHRLSGTAGSYALSSVSDAARRGEALCATVESAIAGATLRALHEVLSDIRAGLAAAGADSAQPDGRHVTRVLAFRADAAIEAAMRLLEADDSFAVELANEASQPLRADILVVPADDDGLATVGRLRAEPRGGRMTVVMWSKGRDDHRRAVTAGTDDWITDRADLPSVVGSIRAVAAKRFGSAPRVLCVSLDHAESIATVIESAGYAVSIADNAGAAELSLETFEPDLVLAGGETEATLHVARLLRLRSAAAGVPLVLVTSRTHPDPSRLLATTGAAALLQLPIPRGLMLATIANHVDAARARRFLLCRDPLTGCLGAAYFREQLQSRLSSSCFDAVLSLAVVETNGSPRHLISTASVLQQRLRETDVIARIDDGRLAVLMEGIEAGAARALLSRFLDPSCRAVAVDRSSHESAARWLEAALERLRSESGGLRAASRLPLAADA